MGGRCAAAVTKSGCWRRPGPQRGSSRSAEREWIRNGRSSEIEPKPGAIGTAAAGDGSPSGRGKRRTGNRVERGQAAGTGRRTNRLSAGLVSHQTKERSFWTTTVPTERIGFPVLLKANLLIQMVHEGSKRMNLFQYSGPSCGAQSASGSKVLPLILRPAETARTKSLMAWPALGGSCFQDSSRIRDVESSAPASLLGLGEKTKKAIGRRPARPRARRPRYWPYQVPGRGVPGPARVETQGGSC